MRPTLIGRRRIEVPHVYEICSQDATVYNNSKKIPNETISSTSIDESTNFTDYEDFQSRRPAIESVFPDNAEMNAEERELTQYKNFYKQMLQQWTHPRKTVDCCDKSLVIKGQSKSLMNNRVNKSNEKYPVKTFGYKLNSESSSVPSKKLNSSSRVINSVCQPPHNLRDKISELQREKKELEKRLQQQERQKKEKDDDNNALKIQIETLEQMLQNIPRQCVSAPSTSETKIKLDSQSYDSQVLAENEMNTLKREFFRLQQNLSDVLMEKEMLEQQITESEMAKRFITWRYCFRCLDKDHDGLITLEDLIRFETFTPYSLSALQRAYHMFPRSDNGRHFNKNTSLDDFADSLAMDEDDVVKFVAWAEEKSLKESMEFWFAVADIDGDGYIGKHDLLELFSGIKEHTQLGEKDLFCQLFDMVQPSEPKKGISLKDLKKCKLGVGVINMIFNHNDGLRMRTTAEWGRAELPL